VEPEIEFEETKGFARGPHRTVVGDPDELCPNERLNQSDVPARAYELWQDRGCPIGSPDVDWFRAAEDLRIPR